MTVNGVPLKVDLMREPWVVEKVVLASRQDVEIWGGGPQNSGAACVESGVEMTQGVPHKANRQ